MFFSLVSSRQDSIFSTIGCSSRIWARTRASVEKPVLPRRLRVRLELLEEDVADLLRRADRELLLGQLVDLLLQGGDPLAEAGADLGQALGVELQPLALHRREDVDQRQLDLAQQRLQAELLDARALGLGERGDQARLLGRVEARLALLVERELAVVGAPRPRRRLAARPIPASAASSVSS